MYVQIDSLLVWTVGMICVSPRLACHVFRPGVVWLFPGRVSIFETSALSDRLMNWQIVYSKAIGKRC